VALQQRGRLPYVRSNSCSVLAICLRPPRQTRDILSAASLKSLQRTTSQEEGHDARTAVNAMGLQLIVVRASSESEINEAFAALVQQRAAGLIVASDLFLTTRMNQLIMLAARHAMPAVYPWRDAVTAGGLASYGIDIAESYRQVGDYVGRILKGAKPAELPVLQPTKFSLAINLQTAKTLGLEVPQTLLVRADEVIE
jgi:putative tryptophan/tyrosine transport system substrate-binding protein